MTLEFEQLDRNLVVKLKGELDHHSAEIVREKIDRSIDRGGIKNLIFDCSKMDFMDSSGLGVMMGRFKKLKSMGGQVVISGINPNIDRVFKLSGIYKIISKYENLEKAIEKLGEGK
ncbi:MAG: spoIIAA [Clostridiales bacterium]|jgi:stage II sporulation protein AA (anti-sigma F factor antagonist)|nr:spoIIAA [Clostridiales bacterium]